jgi:hypothetical protein
MKNGVILWSIKAMYNIILLMCLKSYYDDVPCNYVIPLLLLIACYQTRANVIGDTKLQTMKN